MNKALLKQTRVRPSATAEDLLPLLSKVFRDDTYLIRRYSDPTSLNGLLEWIPLDQPQKTLAVIILGYGLGTIEKRTKGELTQLTGFPPKRVEMILGGSSDRQSCRSLLGTAHKLVGGRAEILASNELRQAGLHLRVWHVLARDGGILTIDELCAHEVADLAVCRGIGPDSIQQIKEALRRIGRKLKS